jgi:hypothetical protein
VRINRITWCRVLARRSKTTHRLEAHMRRLIGASVIVGVLLVAGATAVMAQPEGQGGGPKGGAGPGTLLGDVLAGLVEDGTINQPQADAILEAVDKARAEQRARWEQARAERRAEWERLRAEHQKVREQLRGFLEDGEISADELAQLPETHPLRTLDEFLADGKLDREELKSLRGQWFGRRGHGLGMGMGRGFGWGPMPEASPAAGS